VCVCVCGSTIVAPRPISFVLVSQVMSQDAAGSYTLETVTVFNVSAITTITIYRENSYFFVRFEVFTAATMKNIVVWDVALCRSCVNRSLRHIPEDDILQLFISLSSLHTFLILSTFISFSLSFFLQFIYVFFLLFLVSSCCPLSPYSLFVCLLLSVFKFFYRSIFRSFLPSFSLFLPMIENI
jgi:uncharacterized membrane protein (GlpM family)